MKQQEFTKIEKVMMEITNLYNFYTKIKKLKEYNEEEK